MRNLKLLERFKSNQIHALNSPDSSSSRSNGSPRIKFLGYPKSPKTNSTLVTQSLFSYEFPTAELLEPPLDSHLKPIDLVETLSTLYRRIDSCSESEKPMLYVEQYAVLQGLGDAKQLRRCLRNARLCATDVPCKTILSAWLRFQRREDEFVGANSMDCNGYVLECPKANLVHGYDLDRDNSLCKCSEICNNLCNHGQVSQVRVSLSPEEDSDVSFFVDTEEIRCVRSKIAALSSPFQAMLYGGFAESRSSWINFSENGVSIEGMKALDIYSRIKRVDLFRVEIVLELLGLAAKFCCDDLKSACDSHLASLISGVDEALMFIELGLEEHAKLLVSACLQVFLRELPGIMYNPEVMRIFCDFHSKELTAFLGVRTLFLLFYFLSQVAVEEKLATNTILILVERMKQFADSNWQKALAFHQMGCALLERHEYRNAQYHFRLATSLGHVYSLAGVARTNYKQGQRYSAYKLMTSLVSGYVPLGWMYQERSLYNVGKDKIKDLEVATELDPTLSFPYKYRAVMKAKDKQIKEAISEIDRIIRFKLTQDCLEVRAWLYIAIGDFESSLRDIRAILSLEPNYEMFGGKVRGDHLVEILRCYVKEQTEADRWMKLYDRWSAVDDIGSLAVIHEMLQNDPTKNFLRFRQSLLLLRLNCQKAAMRCLRLARNQTDSGHERFVYEGWILYDTGHHEQALSKAEKAISIQRSFEAFFLKAYILADQNLDSDTSSPVIQLLEEALKCPSDGLRKGQALNNLGSVYIDCGELDKAERAYSNALDIKHTRAHQGLARVHFMKNQRKAAYEEMTKLIDKAYNKASAYEKRSEYRERDRVKDDLDMATRLDPLRTYPYRYRAAVLMDDQKETEAVEELSKAIAFRPDLQMLHLRAAFYEAMGKLPLAAQDCEAALCLDPSHIETLDLYCRSMNRDKIIRTDQ